MTHWEHWKISDEITSQISSHLWGLRAVKTSRWAILLCKFADDKSSTTARSHYERLFTGTGSGSLNMTDFFADMSHGLLDLTGSKVLGWYTLDLDTADYAGNVAMPPSGKVNRNGLFAACRQKATDAGVDLSTYDGVVVSMNGGVDLFGYVGGMAAFCDSDSLQPSLLGQEMGHGYGLDHARRDGSEDDYADPWDVMSTANAYSATDTEWTSIGPGLCASSMRSREWLDEARTWKATNSAFDSTIELRPLHQRGLPGNLAAEVGQYLVELRVRERWDAGLPYPAVLVHRFSDNHSYLSAVLQAGQVFENGIAGFRYGDYQRVEVVSLDESGRRATVRLTGRVGEPMRWGVEAAKLFGGVAVDGGGFIIVGGKIIKVPPRGPIRELLQQVLALHETDEIGDINVRGSARIAAWQKVLATASQGLLAQDPMRSPSRHRRLKDGPHQADDVDETVISESES